MSVATGEKLEDELDMETTPTLGGDVLGWLQISRRHSDGKPVQLREALQSRIAVHPHPSSMQLRRVRGTIARRRLLFEGGRLVPRRLQIGVANETAARTAAGAVLPSKLRLPCQPGSSKQREGCALSRDSPSLPRSSRVEALRRRDGSTYVRRYRLPIELGSFSVERLNPRPYRSPTMESGMR